MCTVCCRRLRILVLVNFVFVGGRGVFLRYTSPCLVLVRFACRYQFCFQCNMLESELRLRVHVAPLFLPSPDGGGHHERLSVGDGDVRDGLSVAVGCLASDDQNRFLVHFLYHYPDPRGLCGCLNSCVRVQSASAAFGGQSERSAAPA